MGQPLLWDLASCGAVCESHPHVTLTNRAGGGSLGVEAVFMTEWAIQLPNTLHGTRGRQRDQRVVSERHECIAVVGDFPYPYMD